MKTTILEITFALPGSGKTYWAKDKAKSSNEKRIYRKHSNNYISHIEFDAFKERYKDYSPQKVKEEFLKEFKNSVKSSEDVILDVFISKASEIFKIFKEGDIDKNKFNKIVLHYWIPNIENSLHNDIGRREKSSTITIQNAKIEKPDLEQFKKDFQEYFNLSLENLNKIEFEMEIHSVEKKENWQILADKFNYGEEILKSERWCIGGTWRNCWGDKGNVSEEDEPEFTLLDELLNKVIPNITFLQYKKLVNDCEEIVEDSDGDYYGGTTWHKQKTISISRLYEHLVENNIIEDDVDFLKNL